MKKSGNIFFILFTLAYISFIPSSGLASDTYAETQTLLKRTPSQEELIQLQGKKAVLLQQVQDLQKRERHWVIEILRKEVNELEALKLSLEKKLELPLVETENINMPEAVTLPLTPLVENQTTKTMEELLFCITTNYDAVVANMHSSRNSHYGNNVQYGLIKLNDSDNVQVKKAFEIISYEKGLSPCDGVVKDYINNRFLKPVENETLYTEDVTFENVNFLAKFYVLNYDSVIHKTQKNNEFFVFPVTLQFTDTFPQLKGRYKEKLNGFLTKGKFEPFFTYNNTLYCNYGFTIRNTSFGGYLLLEKPFDVHKFYK